MTNHPLISSLLMGGFSNEESSACGEEKIDEYVSVETAIHVVDADSSQTAAIEEVKAGRSLVIQGPPGTGKSQTIANLIAAAVAQNRKVLFVAEKLAALEVVKRRLDAIDLGNLCLELHSRKANKKAVLQELRQTLALASPRMQSRDSLFERLRNVRGSLNEFCETMHKVQEPSCMTAYRILGELVRLYGRDPAVPEFQLVDAIRWTREQHQNNRAVFAELIARGAPIFPAVRHVWRGVSMDVLMPADKQRLLRTIKETIDVVSNFAERVRKVGVLLGHKNSTSLREAQQLAVLGRHFASGPDLDRNAAAMTIWTENPPAIANALTIGERYAALVAELQPKLTDTAWFEDVRSIRDTLSRHGGSLKRLFSKEYRHGVRQLRALLRIPAPKVLSEQLALLDALIEYQEQWHSLAAVIDVGRTAFGAVWNDHQSDWSKLREIVEWITELGRLVATEEFLLQLPLTTKATDVLLATATLEEALEPCQSALQRLVTNVQLDPLEAFQVTELDQIPLESAAARFAEWPEAFEALPAWITFRQELNRARELGLTEVSDQFYHGHVNPGTAVDLFDKVRFETVLSAIIANHTVLQTFNGAAHDRRVAEFRSLDLARIEFARYEVALAH
ncbi:MAG: AAA domain-containing protein, partial [Chthoniobacterales bacterium]